GFGVAVFGHQRPGLCVGLLALGRVELGAIAVAQPCMGGIATLGGNGHPGIRRDRVLRRTGAVVVHARKDRLRFLVAVARGAAEAQVGLPVPAFGARAFGIEAPADVRSRREQAWGLR